MEVDYQNNLGDLIRANFYMLPRSRAYRILGGLILVGLACISYYLASSPNLTTSFSQVLTFLIALLISVVSAAVVMALAVLVFVSLDFLLTRKEQTRACKMSTTERGIKVETEVSRSDMFWSDIREVSRTKTHLYIFVPDGAVIIPLRTFGEPAKAEQFYEAFSRLWNKAKDTPHG
jgi:hypothetical protein